MEEGFFRIEKKGYGIYVGFKAGVEVTPDMVIRAMEAENSRYAIKGRCDLWDFRGCRPSADFGYEAMQRLIQHIDARYEDWSEKTALVVDGEIQFGLSRMFQSLVDSYPTHIGIFQDEMQAQQWIGEAPVPGQTHKGDEP